MNVGKTLKQIRKNKKIIQKNLGTDYLHSSSYSRVESNERSIRLRDLKDVLDKMSIRSEEFFSLGQFDKEQNEFRKLFYHCSENLNDKVSKKMMIDYYDKSVAESNDDLRSLCNMISIKNYFHQFWSGIPMIDSRDIELVYSILRKKDYFYQYDYALISNMIPYFSKEQADYIVKKSFPIKDESVRDSTTKKFAYNAIFNYINMKIYSEELDTARLFLELVKKQEYPQGDIYKLELHFFVNLLDFLENGDSEAYNKVLTFINLVEDMGNHFEAEQRRSELNFLTQKRFNETFQDGKPQFPIGLIKEG